MFPLGRRRSNPARSCKVKDVFSSQSEDEAQSFCSMLSFNSMLLLNDSQAEQLTPQELDKIRVEQGKESTLGKGPWHIQQIQCAMRRRNFTVRNLWKKHTFRKYNGKFIFWFKWPAVIFGRMRYGQYHAIAIDKDWIYDSDLEVPQRKTFVDPSKKIFEKITAVYTLLKNVK